MTKKEQKNVDILTKNADVNTIVNYTQHGNKWRYKKANNQTNNSMCMNNSTNKKKNNKNKRLESIKQKMDEDPHPDSEKGETDDTTEEERVDKSGQKKEKGRTKKKKEDTA